jgi:hypothetical protein
MTEIENHYCLGGEAHPDNCDCTCDTCKARREILRQEAFNKRLSEAIGGVLNDYDFRIALAKELMKKDGR